MKSIIVCCDGTWNKPEVYKNGKKIETNVQKIYEGIKSEESDNQVKFYGSGVGTGFSLSNNIFGGAFGRGIDNNIKDAYKFLMWNYKEGDKIYLFGFSRGAYTVRSLAGMIRNCGIMQPQYLHLVEEAYNLYRERTPLTHPDSDLMKSFRKAYGAEEETPIEFVGIWDTVGALGIPLSSFSWFNKKYHFHDVKLGRTIKYAYHALSIDEKRKIFEPALWEVDSNNNNQVCEQVWFPGVHSNVGGGYPDCKLSDIALKWMYEKAEKAGLKFSEKFEENIKGDSCGKLENSASGIFFFTPKILRDINKGFVNKKDPETGELKKEKAITNESLHYTCFERCHKLTTYRPANFFNALKSNTPYDPAKEKWKEDWLAYLQNVGEYQNRRKRFFLFSLFKKLYLNKFKLQQYKVPQ